MKKTLATLVITAGLTVFSLSPAMASEREHGDHHHGSESCSPSPTASHSEDPSEEPSESPSEEASESESATPTESSSATESSSETPTPDPTQSASDTQTPVETSATEVPSDPTTMPSTGPRPALADTGSSSLGWLAGALLALGVSLILAGRRKGSHQ